MKLVLTDNELLEVRMFALDHAGALGCKSDPESASVISNAAAFEAYLTRDSDSADD